MGPTDGGLDAYQRHPDALHYCSEMTSRLRSMAMTFRTLLVHVDNSDRCRARVELAADFAYRFPAHLTGIYLPFHPPGFPDVTAMGGTGLPPPPAPESDPKRLAQAEQMFSEVCRRQDVSPEWITPRYEESSEMRTHARYADLVIVGQEDRSDPESSPTIGFVASVVLGGGRPVLILPYAGKLPTAFNHILVAWDGGREAARAAADAMPFLRSAKAVDVMHVSRVARPDDLGPIPGMDIAMYFARHGVNVTVTPECRTNDVAIGEALLSRAADLNADLIVMGGYGHSRMQEWVLGGVTRTMLESMTIPVLMSH
ncbi:universal stress protein [Pandoraea sputorum]|uniref:universal stress protein n=2 Tax=Pandoraea sputorum TaxID=93222 RepID=UPI0030C74555